MSDNITPDEVKRRLVIFLRIPTEVWTDVLKLLPRSILVQKIAPACYRLKEISDKNVKNVHVIKSAKQFTDSLEEDDIEANQQLENLASNKCQLASQFRLTYFSINEKSKVILSHCPDLFKGCQITLDIKEKNKDSPLFSECLTEFEKAEPTEIRIIQRVNQLVDYWHHPTILKCTRVDLDFWPILSEATMTTAFENIFDWLHHKPIGMDSNGAAIQHHRCMIIWFAHPNHLDLLLNRCSEDVQQAQQPVDRRRYVLSFAGLDFDWSGFGQFRRIENKSTGEVLTLERKVLANGHATQRYRLRRCLTEEEANGQLFYAEMFEQGYMVDMFDIGDDTPEVMIK